jgi:hypothetical protein
VHATRLRFADWADLMRQVAAAAPQDASVRQSQDIAHEGLRGAPRLTADRLADMGALKENVDRDRATDLLWFYLSNTAYFLRTDELGWTLDESETWLNEISHAGPAGTPDTGRRPRHRPLRHRGPEAVPVVRDAGKPWIVPGHGQGILS